MLRATVQITNTGYRLLRSTVRLEPPSISWVRPAPGFDRGPFATAETTEIPLEIEIPQTLDFPSHGAESRADARLAHSRQNVPLLCTCSIHLCQL